MVVMSNIAKPCRNWSAELLYSFEGPGRSFLAVASRPPMERIWLPPTALHECANRGCWGGYGTLNQWNAGSVRTLIVSY